MVLSFGSLDMEPPYQHELEWGFQRIDLQATRLFQPMGSFRPYLQGRIGFARLHPRSELFNKNPLPADFEVGDSPTPSSNGFHIGLVPGVELAGHPFHLDRRVGDCWTISTSARRTSPRSVKRRHRRGLTGQDVSA
jgi:hypothetical protein